MAVKVEESLKKLSKTGALVAVTSERTKTKLQNFFEPFEEGWIKKLDVWVLHDITMKNLLDQISI